MRSQVLSSEGTEESAVSPAQDPWLSPAQDPWPSTTWVSGQPHRPVGPPPLGRWDLALVILARPVRVTGSGTSLGLEAGRGPPGPSSLAPSLTLHPQETVFCKWDILRAMAARANGDSVSGAGEDHLQPQEGGRDPD